MGNVPSNNSKQLSPEKARAAARKRTAAALAARQQQEREKLERALAAERKAMELNENSIADYLRAESTIAAAQHALEEATTRGRRDMAQAIADIARRAGSVSAAAELLDITAGQASATLRAAGVKVKVSGGKTAAADPGPDTAAEAGSTDTATEPASAAGDGDAGPAKMSA